VVIAPAEFFFPNLLLILVGHVVIAGHVEERHLQLGGKGLELLPLLEDFIAIFRVAFDQVANRKHKLRLKQIDLLDGPREYFLSMPAGAITDDDELKILGGVVELEVAPWVSLFGLNAKIGIVWRDRLRGRL